MDNVKSLIWTKSFINISNLENFYGNMFRLAASVENSEEFGMLNKGLDNQRNC